MAKQVSLAEIRTDGGTQMRQQIDTTAVSDYAEAFKGGAEFPPVKVFWDGIAYWLADGFHRWHAARTAGLEKIKCDVEQGTLRDAILYAVGANVSNGMRRTNGDKRVCVMTLLHDTEWCKRTDRWIAEKCCVTHPTVADYRKQAGALEESSNANLGKKECKDGRSYPAKRSSPKKPDLHVPPIDEDIEVEKPAAPAPQPKVKEDAYENERNLVRALAELVQLIKQTRYKLPLDTGRLTHELNAWANEIAEGIEEADTQ